jgi:hypothetical protein
MSKFRLRRSLRDAYRFPGFVPALIIHGVFGDPQVRVLSLKRRQKKPRAESVAAGIAVTTIESSKWCEIYLVAICASTWSWKCGV